MHYLELVDLVFTMGTVMRGPAVPRNEACYLLCYTLDGWPSKEIWLMISACVGWVLSMVV